MKSKSARAALSVLFLLMLFVPGPLWAAVGGKIPVDVRENRELAEWPQFSFRRLDSLPADYEAYYRDHLPFRSQLISAYARFLRGVFGDAVVTTVAFGKDGWFFYKNVNDGDPVASYRGEDLFTPSELRQIVIDLRKTRDNLKKRGIEFVLFIAPNKARVYSEYMPDRYGAPAEDYAARQLVDFLRAHSDIRVVYCYDELMAAKAQYPDTPLYYRTDTHWNLAGAYVGTRTLLNELGISLPPYSAESVQPETGPGYEGDLAILCHLLGAVEPDGQYSVAFDHPDFTLRSEEDGLRYLGTGDPAGRRLFIKTDSFSTNMLAYVMPWFSETYLTFNQLYDPAQVDAFAPDVFVQVCVERYVKTQLTKGEIYGNPALFQEK